MTSKIDTTSTAVRYFVAEPANSGTGIFGLGHTAEQAIADAHAQGQTRPATVTPMDDGMFVVNYDGEAVGTYDDEDRAHAHAHRYGFEATECTERLYRHVESHGCDASSPGYSWVWTDAQKSTYDLQVDEEAFASALEEVLTALHENDNDRDAWKAEDALADAREYVDAYVAGDDSSEWYLAVNEDAALRTALDLAVRDNILETIAEREAA
ncbi:hypothetical protein MKK68_19520 [Methylobacterium sp. E-016]|uniref:hypothetical protein n=1 Tax=Methylobacterium sp. E-016 TaxID=2836556 RepID=UPI001FBB24B2|nr:hypothetical protein [Methylobacterium sp. E-016]MCJ2077806.1 hypothetical protein [Methylobacterium sp. E-016]